MTNDTLTLPQLDERSLAPRSTGMFEGELPYVMTVLFMLGLAVLEWVRVLNNAAPRPMIFFLLVGIALLLAGARARRAILAKRARAS
jgi:hypothetical protein